jgi:hypothetical protein
MIYVVDMVSTVHDGFETVTRARKKPRENQLNRAAVRSVSGSHWEAVSIDIPQCIDNYNNLMGGVDKAYQLMSGLKPRLRCRRTRMSMWLHSLAVCRVNSYIIAKQRKRYIQGSKRLCRGLDLGTESPGKVC